MAKVKSSKKNKVEKVDYSKFEGKLPNEIIKRLMNFSEQIDPKDLKPLTEPSAILVGGTREIKLEKLSPEKIEHFLWNHPVVPRGIEIKANRMINRGYTVKPYVVDGSDKPTDSAIKAAKSMESILENSGGVITIKKLIEDAFGFGNGYRTLVPNKSGNKILRLNLEHPIYFRVATYPKDYKDEYLAGKMKIDKKTKKPISYTQVRPLDSSTELVPFGEEISSEMVVHLVFDTWGDEVVGISLIQYLWMIIKYLLNIEEAAAERLYRDGFVQKKVTTNIRSEKGIKEMAKNLTQINSRDAIILPEGTDVQNLNPGTSDFPRFHQVFITLLAIRLGIPKPLLTMDGTSTNKATLDEQKKDVLADFSADEKIVENTINTHIFRTACKFEFGEEFDEFPTFHFNEISEDKDIRAERLLKTSMYILNFTDSIKTLSELGKVEEVNKLVNMLIDNLPEE